MKTEQTAPKSKTYSFPNGRVIKARLITEVWPLGPDIDEDEQRASTFKVKVFYGRKHHTFKCASVEHRVAAILNIEEAMNQ